ncbi:hypothetical protein [Kitasatospora sp. NPDC090091]|uniref:hypothetical protein n=1 Tax=Kitasatospora sp. NPDC090091 TaxID=3364081 RepID=UPI0038033766
MVASVLCGVDVLAMASTWLPGEQTVPKWLVVGLFVAVFPVFLLALIRTFVGGAGHRLLGRHNAGRFAGYLRLLPPALKLSYALVLCLAVLGFATGASAAEDVQADASGHYYTHWDSAALHSVRVDLTEPEYYEALKAQFRLLSAGPAVFYAISSLLVLAAATVAAARARTATRT